MSALQFLHIFDQQSPKTELVPVLWEKTGTGPSDCWRQ